MLPVDPGSRPGGQPVWGPQTGTEDRAQNVEGSNSVPMEVSLSIEVPMYKRRLARIKQLLRKYPIGRSSLYRGVQLGLLPAPIKISDRCSAWPEEEFDAIIDARASGASDAEIKLLVKRLAQARKLPLTDATHPSTADREGL